MLVFKSISIRSRILVIQVLSFVSFPSSVYGVSNDFTIPPTKSPGQCERNECLHETEEFCRIHLPGFFLKERPCAPTKDGFHQTCTDCTFHGRYEYNNERGRIVEEYYTTVASALNYGAGSGKTISGVSDSESTFWKALDPDSRKSDFKTLIDTSDNTKILTHGDPTLIRATRCKCESVWPLKKVFYDQSCDSTSVCIEPGTICFRPCGNYINLQECPFPRCIWEKPFQVEKNDKGGGSVDSYYSDISSSPNSKKPVVAQQPSGVCTENPDWNQIIAESEEGMRFLSSKKVDVMNNYHIGQSSENSKLEFDFLIEWDGMRMEKLFDKDSNENENYQNIPLPIWHDVTLLSIDSEKKETFIHRIDEIAERIVNATIESSIHPLYGEAYKLSFESFKKQAKGYKIRNIPIEILIEGEDYISPYSQEEDYIHRYPSFAFSESYSDKAFLQLFTMLDRNFNGVVDPNELRNLPNIFVMLDTRARNYNYDFYKSSELNSYKESSSTKRVEDVNLPNYLELSKRRLESLRGRRLESLRGRRLESLRGRRLESLRGRRLESLRGRRLESLRGRQKVMEGNKKGLAFPKSKKQSRNMLTPSSVQNTTSLVINSGVKEVPRNVKELALKTGARSPKSFFGRTLQYGDLVNGASNGLAPHQVMADTPLGCSKKKLFYCGITQSCVNSCTKSCGYKSVELLDWNLCGEPSPETCKVLGKYFCSPGKIDSSCVDSCESCNGFFADITANICRENWWNPFLSIPQSKIDFNMNFKCRYHRKPGQQCIHDQDCPYGMRRCMQIVGSDIESMKYPQLYPPHLEPPEGSQKLPKYESFSTGLKIKQSSSDRVCMPLQAYNENHICNSHFDCPHVGYYCFRPVISKESLKDDTSKKDRTTTSSTTSSEATTSSTTSSEATKQSGLVIIPSTCKRQLDEGKKCTYDFECGVNLLCNKLELPSPVCRSMFSLELGRRSSDDRLCKFGYKNSHKICSIPPKSKNLGRSCNSDQDCDTTDVGHTIFSIDMIDMINARKRNAYYGKCVCNPWWDGSFNGRSKYCSPVIGDLKQYAKYFRDWEYFRQIYCGKFWSINECLTRFPNLGRKKYLKYRCELQRIAKGPNLPPRNGCFPKNSVLLLPKDSVLKNSVLMDSVLSETNLEENTASGRRIYGYQAKDEFGEFITIIDTLQYKQLGGKEKEIDYCWELELIR